MTAGRTAPPDEDSDAMHPTDVAPAPTAIGIRRRIGVALVLLLVAPPVGLAVFGGLATIEDLAHSGRFRFGLGEILAGYPSGLPFAYAAGGLPALLVGATLAPRLLAVRFDLRAHFLFALAVMAVTVAIPGVIDLAMNGGADPLGIGWTIYRWLAQAAFVTAPLAAIAVRLVFRPGTTPPAAT